MAQQASQPQHLYPQVPAGQLHATQPGSQAEYMQGAAPGSAAPSLPLCQVAALLSAGGALVPPNSDSAVQGTGHAHAGQANNHSAVMQQKPVTQHQPGGSGQVLGPQPMVYGVPAVSSTLSATPITMPNVSGTVLQSQQSSHTTVSRSTSLVQPIGLPVQGIAHSNLPQSALGHFQTLGQIDDRRKSEPLPQPPLSLIAEHKHSMKPPILDTLTNPHLPVTTPMNTLTSSVFGITIPVDGDDDSTSSASAVAIDNKIEQAMDLVKSHLMYAVREEVEVLKEQIKELIERNCTLERENALLKSLTNNDQLASLSTQPANPSSTSQHQTVIAQPPQTPPSQQPNVSSA